MSFNLLDQPWITVQEGPGQRLVSLREALVRAHELVRLVGDIPTQEPPIVRLLLAVVTRAYGVDDRRWQQLWEMGRFPGDELDAYLAKWRHRFELFDERAPFMQVAGLHTAKDETKSVAVLIPQITSGNGTPIFSAITDGQRPAQTPAEAARWLLHAHAWDTAAFKSGAVDDPRVSGGKTTGNATGPLGQLGVVLATGTTLHQTLLLNLVPTLDRDSHEHDMPCWERTPATAAWEQRPVNASCDLFTWQSRRIRLVHDDDAQVRSVVLSAGDRLSITPWGVEPHTAWRNAAKGTGAIAEWRPRRHRPGQPAWQGIDGLLPLRGSHGSIVVPDILRRVGDLRQAGVLEDAFCLGVITYGLQYGNQSATVADAMHDAIPLSVLALDRDNPGVAETLAAAAQAALDAAWALQRCAHDLARAAGGEQGRDVRTQYLATLDVLVRALLRQTRAEPHRIDELVDAWRRRAYQVALRVLDQMVQAAPPSTFQGRAPDKKPAFRLASAEASCIKRLREALTVGQSQEVLSHA